jgi:UDP-glucuronate 4-epimerase
VLETARRLSRLKSFVYASSSSVYGHASAQPFSTEDRADHPVSLYAATKRAAELITESYRNLYALPCIGLRFFTVYGPWGRPDMAYYSFTKSILERRPIEVFNHGKMARDFTYIGDVVPAIIAAVARAGTWPVGHRLYNVGNNRPEQLLEFIAVLERAIGRQAIKKMLPMQAGDVTATCADIEAARADLGFEPRTPIAVGLPRFVAWYRDYYKLT